MSEDNNNTRFISKDEILDELERLTEEVVNLSERVRLLLENMGFLVI